MPQKQHDSRASDVDVRSLTLYFDGLIQVTKWGVQLSLDTKIVSDLPVPIFALIQDCKPSLVSACYNQPLVFRFFIISPGDNQQDTLIVHLQNGCDNSPAVAIASPYPACARCAECSGHCNPRPRSIRSRLYLVQCLDLLDRSGELDVPVRV